MNIGNKMNKKKILLKVDLMKLKYYLAYHGVEFMYPVYEKFIKKYYKRLKCL